SHGSLTLSNKPTTPCPPVRHRAQRFQGQDPPAAVDSASLLGYARLLRRELSTQANSGISRRASPIATVVLLWHLRRRPCNALIESYPRFGTCQGTFSCLAPWHCHPVCDRSGHGTSARGRPFLHRFHAGMARARQFRGEICEALRIVVPRGQGSCFVAGGPRSDDGRRLRRRCQVLTQWSSRCSR